MEGVDMKDARKLTALFVALIMILGMIPMASAELTNCSHHWDDGRWLNGEPSNCLDWKTRTYTCTICGATRDWNECGSCVKGSKVWIRPQGSNCMEFGVWEITCKYCGEWMEGNEEPGPHNWVTRNLVEPSCIGLGLKYTVCTVCLSEQGDRTYVPVLGHDWGSWYWAHGEVPSCNQGAWQVRECKRCGQMEDRWTEGTNHIWGEWKVYTAPACTEKGLEHSECIVCGDFWTRDLEALGHEMGEWTVVKQPTEEEDGLKERKCTRCDHKEQEAISFSDENQSGYRFATLSKSVTTVPANGESYVLGEIVSYDISLNVPDGLVLMSVEITDPIKGNGENACVDTLTRVEGGQYSYSVSYAVTQQDVNNGFISNVASAYFYDLEGDAWVRISSNEVVVLTSGQAKDDQEITGLTLTKKIISKAAGESGKYDVGEVITYMITAENKTGMDLYNVEISDPMCPEAGAPVIDTFARMPDGTGVSVLFRYIVTEEDAKNSAGGISNTAYAVGYTKDGIQANAESNTVFVGVISSGDNGGVDLGGTVIAPEESGADATLEKYVNNVPVNGEYFAPGEMIEYAVVFMNMRPYDLNDVEITDPLKGGNEDSTISREPVVGPGETLQQYFHYIVTEEDAERGYVENTATAYWYNPETDESGSCNSNTVTAKAGKTENDDVENEDGIPDDPFGVLVGLEVTEEVESLPLNGSYYTEGETVAYRITYTNGGEMPLTDVLIFDALSDMTEVGSAENLNPGESRQCFVNHTVTAQDVVRGYVSNMAMGQYSVSGFTSVVYSDTVTVDTDGLDNIWGVYDPDGTDTYPELGWVDIYYPTDDDDNIPPFGTVDLEKMTSGKDYCVRAINERDNASFAGEVSFCQEHADTQSTVMMMNQMGATPEMQIQAAAYAVSLWQYEIENLYQELMAAADPTARAVLMNEYLSFQADLANYETMLKTLNPDDAAVIARKIAAMWQDKCVTLCMESNMPVLSRKDSLLAVTAKANAVSDACTCLITKEEAGKQYFSESFCAQHAFPFSMIDILAGGQDTVGVWTKARQIWNVEFTNAYNRISEELGEHKQLAQVEKAAFIQWMSAREASLIAMYPDNPELVAQTMVKIIIDRVNDLCAALE